MAEQRVALITGCGKENGIGAATARLMAGSGVAVVVTDVAMTGAANAGEDSSEHAAGWRGLESLVAEIVDQGGEAVAAQGDVTREDDTARMVAEAVDRFGRLDILVNNAGAPHGPDRTDIENVPADAWDRVMAINVRGGFLMSRAAVPHMRRNRWGRIIGVSSAAGVHGLRNMTAYAASKAAILGFTRALAMDVAPWGITANAVCPGSTLTSRALSTARRQGYASAEEGLAARAKSIPLGRHGTPEEVAGTIAFLASDVAGYITGQHILIDGGKGTIPQPQPIQTPVA